jgi:hypothetical protein
MEQDKGFLAKLFDLSFSHFITPRVIGVLYALSILFAFLFAMAAVGGAFSQDVIYGIIVLAISPLWLLVFIVISRVVSEIIIALFRVVEDIGFIADRAQEISRSQEQS